VRQADDAAGAAQPEDRQPPHVGAQAEPIDDQGIEARGRHAGGGDRDDPVDVVERKAGERDAAAGRLGQQGDRVLDEQPAALDPAMRLQVPLARHAGIAMLDAGIAEDRQHAPDLGAIAVEQPHGVVDHQVLRDRVRRHRGGERQQAGQWRHAGIGHGPEDLTEDLARRLAGCTGRLHGQALQFFV